MDYKELRQYIRDQQDREIVGIKLGFDRFRKVLDCIDKKDYWIITSQTSGYKSSFAMVMVVLQGVKFIRDNPSVDLHVKYYALEETSDELLVRLTSNLLDLFYGIEVSENALHGREEKLSAEVNAYLDELEPFLSFFLEKVEIIETIRNPTGIYMDMKEFMDANGTTDLKQVPDANSPGGYRNIPIKYNPHNPEWYMWCVVDHIGLVTPEEGQSLFQAIGTLSNRYFMRLKNFYKCSIIAIQQQTMVGDQVALDFKGNKLEDKLSPSLSDLGDNKSTARDATHVISLFNPANYDLKEYKKYQGLQQMGGRFLQLWVHKNRRGPKNVGIGLWVNPVTKMFEEFPMHNDVSGITSFLQSKLSPRKLIESSAPNGRLIPLNSLVQPNGNQINLFSNENVTINGRTG